MKPIILIFLWIMLLSLTNIAAAQENEVIDSTLQYIERKNDVHFSSGSQKHGLRAGGFGFTLQSGILMSMNLYAASSTKGLYKDDQDKGAAGFPIGGGFYYCISDHVICGVDYCYTRINSEVRSFFSNNVVEKRTWSIFEYGTYMQYLLWPYSKNSVYAKAGVKIINIKGTFQDMCPEKGAVIETDIPAISGWGVAFGLTRTTSQPVKIFAEVGLNFSRLNSKGKEIKVDGEAVAWKYPSDLEIYKFRVGLIISIGGGRHES